MHRGTAGGGGETMIGDRNLFMAYAHVAHDCRRSATTPSSATTRRSAATSTVEDFATVSAGSGVHQFCRVGRHAFIGGYSVVTKDALPFAQTVGSRAQIYGFNTIGLVRRGMPADIVASCGTRTGYCCMSKLNTTRALAQIEKDPRSGVPEVQYLVDFIRNSKRGVVLRRGAAGSKSSSKTACQAPSTRRVTHWL